MAEDFVLERAQRRARRAREAQENFGTSDTGIIDQLGEAVRAPVSAAESLITGKGRIRPGDVNVPELPDVAAPLTLSEIVRGDPSPLGGAQAADAAPSSPDMPIFEKPSVSELMAFAKTDVGKLGILKRLVRGVEHESDDAGNIIVTIGDDQAVQMKINPGRYFLNRPGISGQDASDMINTGAIELFTSVPGAALGAKVIGRFGQALARSFGSGLGLSLGLGAGSVAQDVLGGQLGSGESIDPISAGVASIFGIAGAALGALGNRLIPGLRRILRSPLNFDETGRTLSRRGRKAFRNMGADPDLVTAETILEFDNLTLGRGKPSTPGEAVAAAEARSLPTEVPMRPGDLGGDVAAQSAESSAFKGAFGDKIRADAVTMREAQSTALEANMPGIQRRITGREPGALVRDRGEGVEEVQKGLQRGIESAKRAIDKAFDVARTSKSLRFKKEPLERFAANLRLKIEDEFVGTLSDTSAAIKAIKFLEGPRVLGKRGVKGRRIPTVRVNDLEKFRARANTLMRGLKDPTERRALGFVIKSFDDAIDQSVNAALVRGDIATLKKFRNARFLRRKMGQKFESNKIVSALMEVSEESGDAALRLNPTEASNFLFTAEAIGAKKGVSAAVRKLKRIFGADSVEFKALQEEAVVRLFEAGKKGTVTFPDDAGRTFFSGEKFETALDDAMRKTSEVMRELFTPADLELLQQFKRVAVRATVPVQGAVNTSNSTIKFIQTLTGHPSAVSAVLKKLIGFVPANMEASAAEKAIRPVTQKGLRRQFGKQRTGSIFGVTGATVSGRRRRRGPQITR